MIQPRVQLLKLGLRSYMPTWTLQKELVNKVKGTKNQNYLILVEHNPVYTTGIRTNVYDSNIENRLTSLGAEFVRSNRGGLITFHGPGQLVAYPILNLAQFYRSEQSGKRLKLLGMKWYIDTLEEVVIQTLKNHFAIQAFRSPHTGVWVDFQEEKKICAMGVHNSDLVTCHGLALNCDIDLSWFDHIVPCGIEGKGVTSISNQVHKTITVQEVQSKIVKEFENCFSCIVDEVDIKDI